MKKIMLYLDYGGYPIASLNDEGLIIDDMGAFELGFDSSFCDRVQQLQDMYDSLFINNKVEFKYIGNEKPKVLDEIKNLYNSIAKELKDKLGKDYSIKIEQLHI